MLQRKLPIIIEDGNKTIEGVNTIPIFEINSSRKKQKLVKTISHDLLLSKKVIPIGEEFCIDWLYNGPGSITTIPEGKIVHAIQDIEHVNVTNATLSQLINLAIRTTEAIGIKFTAVDIAEIEEEKIRSLYV